MKTYEDKLDDERRLQYIHKYEASYFNETGKLRKYDEYPIDILKTFEALIPVLAIVGIASAMLRRNEK
jgi:hypothetical protein